jgi:predicted dehydrogenase
VDREIAAGVAGAGVFGGHHAAKYASLPGVRLAAVFDTDADRAAEVAARFGATAYLDYRAFLDAVDVVTVATPAASHYAIAREALESGRHVLVEKPIALSLSHADRLIDAARARRLVLQVGHQERFVFDAFGLLDGRPPPRSATCIRRNPMTGRGEDVSVVFDLMIHDIDLMRRLGFSTPVEVEAFGVDHEIDARVAFADGAEAIFEASRLAPARERRMTLAYDDGVIEIDFVNRTIANSTPRATEASFDSDPNSFALRDPLGFGVARFLDAVRNGAAPAVSGDDGRDALEWALLVEEASRAAAPARRSARA